MLFWAKLILIWGSPQISARIFSLWPGKTQKKIFAQAPLSFVGFSLSGAPLWQNPLNDFSALWKFFFSQTQATSCSLSLACRKIYLTRVMGASLRAFFFFFFFFLFRNFCRQREVLFRLDLDKWDNSSTTAIFFFWIFFFIIIFFLHEHFFGLFSLLLKNKTKTCPFEANFQNFHILSSEPWTLDFKLCAS